MLEKLDDIDWKQFSCPRGSAEAIPELLRALADTPELSLQAKLERTLHDALPTAHAPTISFLYELIDAEQTQNKSGLIRLVVKLSILGELPRATMRLRSWDVAEAKACYQAAADGEAVLLRAASSEREDVRSHAIWALAFFAAGLQDETVAHIADIAQKAGHFSRACAVLALGIIDFQKNTNTHLPLLQALFDSDTGGNGLVKTATAISILVSASFTTSKRKQKLESGEAMLSFLLDKALPFFAGQQQDENYLPFYAGRMDRYITAVLALADPDKILSMLPALAASLSSLSEKAQKHMIEAMFMLIDKAHPKLKTRDFNAFAPAAQDALRTIATVNIADWPLNYGYRDNFMRFVNCEADTAKIETPIETRKLKIFDKLDEINWKKLHHAYGTAEDVPDLLRALTSLDKKAREDALYELCGNIFHQGTRYSASAYAIPFLYGILDDENTQDKAELISYIVHLATGYPEYWLPRQKVQARTKSEKACYQAVADGEAMLLRASFDKDKAVRSHAVWALAYLAPKLQAATIARIAEMASIVGSEEKASAVFALGIIGFHSREYTYLPLFRELFSDSKDMLVKTAAAISILISACFVAKKSKCESGDEQLRFLAAEALPFFHKPVENFPFNNGDIQGYISSVLALVDAEAAMPVLPALAAVLPAQTATISMSITYAILSLIEKANPELQKPHEDFTAFEPASQNALKAIAKHGGWKVGEVTFANYRELLGDFGYPSNQEAFALFVGVKHA